MIMESVDGSVELSNQITRLMAALTQAEQDNHPTSAPNSPRHRGHGRGQMDRYTPTHPSCHNGWTGLVQTASTCSTSVGHSQSATSAGAPDSKVQHSTGGKSGKKEPGSLQCFKMQGVGHHGSVVCHPSQIFKPSRGELMECGPTPNSQQ